MVHLWQLGVAVFLKDLVLVMLKSLVFKRPLVGLSNYNYPILL